MCIRDRIRADDEKAKIIVLTTFDGDEDIYRAIRAGAKGYLLKEVPRDLGGPLQAFQAARSLM